MNQAFKTKRLTVSAIMLALATVLAIACAFVPFFQLPLGGGFTIASMLPIVLVAYMYGTRWGLLVGAVYSVIQMLLNVAEGSSASTIIGMFSPSSDDYMGMVAAFSIIIIDYVLAYTALGFGGVFRKQIKSKSLALCLGSIFALTLRYICHIVSGAIFYGASCDWFFTPDVVEALTGKGLGLIYSICYNGLYMIPEIIITAIVAVFVARIPSIKRMDIDE